MERTAERKPGDLRDVPRARGERTAITRPTSELFVEVTGDFLASFVIAQQAAQGSGSETRRRNLLHGRSSCDSTPFHNASSAAREARSAAIPAGVRE